MLSPEICSFGPLHLRWYGICAVLGMLSAYFLMTCRCKKYQMNSSMCADLLFVAMVSGLIGARFEYVRREWVAQFQDNWSGIIKIWEGGISFQGGLICAILAICVMCYIRKWNLGNVADLAAPALAFGHGFGRIGCLLNGCCYGVPYDGVFAVHYEGFAHGVFPIQGVEAIFCWLLAGVLLCLEKGQKQKFRLFPLYILFYSFGRFFIEYGRGDYYMYRGAMFTPAQSLFLFVGLPVGIIAYVVAFLWARHCVEKTVKIK